MRTDGQRMTGHAELEREFYGHLSDCQLRVRSSQPTQITQTTTVSIGRPVGAGGFLGGAAEARDARLQREASAQTTDALMRTCMAGHGYIFGAVPD